MEAREAAAALGIAHLIMLDHPDGDLRWAHVTELHAEIVMALRRYDPAAVITFGEDGLYWHLDHVGVHERTTTAVRSLGAGAPPLYYVTMPRGAMRAIVDRAKARGGPRHRRASGVWCPMPSVSKRRRRLWSWTCADWVPRKLAAIRCHRTQMGSDHPFDQIDEADARRWLGVEHFHRAPGNVAEAPVLERLSMPRSIQPSEGRKQY